MCEYLIVIRFTLAIY